MKRSWSTHLVLFVALAFVSALIACGSTPPAQQPAAPVPAATDNAAMPAEETAAMPAEPDVPTTPGGRFQNDYVRFDYPSFLTVNDTEFRVAETGGQDSCVVTLRYGDFSMFITVMPPKGDPRQWAPSLTGEVEALFQEDAFAQRPVMLAGAGGEMAIGFRSNDQNRSETPTWSTSPVGTGGNEQPAPDEEEGGLDVGMDSGMDDAPAGDLPPREEAYFAYWDMFARRCTFTEPGGVWRQIMDSLVGQQSYGYVGQLYHDGLAYGCTIEATALPAHSVTIYTVFPLTDESVVNHFISVVRNSLQFNPNR